MGFENGGKYWKVEGRNGKPNETIETIQSVVKAFGLNPQSAFARAYMCEELYMSPHNQFVQIPGIPAAGHTPQQRQKYYGRKRTYVLMPGDRLALPDKLKQYAPPPAQRRAPQRLERRQLSLARPDTGQCLIPHSVQTLLLKASAYVGRGIKIDWLAQSPRTTRRFNVMYESAAATCERALRIRPRPPEGQPKWLDWSGVIWCELAFVGMCKARTSADFEQAGFKYAKAQSVCGGQSWGGVCEEAQRGQWLAFMVAAHGASDVLGVDHILAVLRPQLLQPRAVRSAQEDLLRAWGEVPVVTPSN